MQTLTNEIAEWVGDGMGQPFLPEDLAAREREELAAMVAVAVRDTSYDRVPEWWGPPSTTEQVVGPPHGFTELAPAEVSAVGAEERVRRGVSGFEPLPTWFPRPRLDYATATGVEVARQMERLAQARTSSYSRPPRGINASSMSFPEDILRLQREHREMTAILRDQLDAALTPDSAPLHAEEERRSLMRDLGACLNGQPVEAPDRPDHYRVRDGICACGFTAVFRVDMDGHIGESNPPGSVAVGGVVGLDVGLDEDRVYMMNPDGSVAARIDNVGTDDEYDDLTDPPIEPRP